MIKTNYFYASFSIDVYFYLSIQVCVFSHKCSTTQTNKLLAFYFIQDIFICVWGNRHWVLFGIQKYWIFCIMSYWINKFHKIVMRNGKEGNTWQEQEIITSLFLIFWRLKVKSKLVNLFLGSSKVRKQIILKFMTSFEDCFLFFCLSFQKMLIAVPKSF